jgi:stearoyl-CoA desaturase (delta-9 desaturase)
LSAQAEYHDDIIYPNTIAFIFVHLAPIAAIWTGVTMTSVILAITLYVVRMFGITAGYHRFFSHRSFKTSRAFQFVLAVIAMSSAQKSVLWWAALHRHHHRHSDQEDDVHSPLHRGFFYSHVGWIFDQKHADTRLDEVPDLAKYPELRFLDKHQLLPAIVLAIVCFMIDGWSGLLIGYFASTAVLYHGTFFINSLAHVHGSQRYVTGDTSRNNWWLAVITLGEGWHNNHHRYQSSTRNGFYWWEFDPTYYGLKLLSYTGFIWGLKPVPPSILDEGANADHYASVAAARRAATLHPEISYATLKRVVPAAAALAVASASAAQATLPEKNEGPALHKDVTELAHEMQAKTLPNPPVI